MSQTPRFATSGTNRRLVALAAAGVAVSLAAAGWFSARGDVAGTLSAGLVLVAALLLGAIGVSGRA